MSKRQELRERRERQKKMQRMMLIGGGLLVVVAIALFFILSANQPVGEIVMPELKPRPQANFNAMGDPNAPVKIIEYSDFQCPYCVRFSTMTEPSIVEQYVVTGKVYFEYRSVGQFIGPESARAAEAAYCAGDQGKFWEMHDVIFANVSGENRGSLSDARLTAFAEKLGLNMNNFKDCFTNGKYKARLLEDQQNAAKDITGTSNYAELVAANQYSAGGISTPSFIVNGRLIPGAMPFEVFQQEIDAALQAAGQ
ncbi:MAG: thioredoxin domain-containing protein [Anaerolineales bacterium]